MEPAIQEEGTGCGIACVATLAGVSYRQAKQVANGLGIFAEDQRLWSETDYVRRLLRQYDIHAARTEARFTSWQTLSRVALLAIKWRLVRGRSFWHWVVFWRGAMGPVVLDPKRWLRTHRRTDFGRMRPRWFITITKPRHSVRAAKAAGREDKGVHR
jgi:hypothetical protein